MSEPTPQLPNAPKARRTVERLREQFLGDEPRYTLVELAQQAGVTLSAATDFWRAMGFADVKPSDPIFTKADVEALRRVHQVVAAGDLNEDAVISLLRANSYSADRLALWQSEALVEHWAQRYELDDVTARLEMVAMMEKLQPFIEDQVLYAMRRHLYSQLERTLAEYGAARRSEANPAHYPLHRSLGFVDMVSYTSTSAHLDHRELTVLIKKFEYTTRDVITSRGARIVKNLGDAVFYIADTLECAAEVVCTLVETLRQTPRMLPVRASLVEGDVVSRSGDVFGPPVNLAARLCSSGPEGRVCLDRATADSLLAAAWKDRYLLESLPAMHIRGIGNVERFTLKPAKGRLSAS